MTEMKKQGVLANFFVGKGADSKCPFHRFNSRLLGMSESNMITNHERDRSNMILDGIGKLLVEIHSQHTSGDLEVAKSKAKEVKKLVGDLSSLGDFKRTVDALFTTHVPDARVREFIMKA